jgi:hypothetical protein
MELWPSQQPIPCADTQEFPNILCNSNAYCHVHAMPTGLYPDTDQSSPYHPTNKQNKLRGP